MSMKNSFKYLFVFTFLVFSIQAHAQTSAGPTAKISEPVVRIAFIPRASQSSTPALLNMSHLEGVSCAICATNNRPTPLSLLSQSARDIFVRVSTGETTPPNCKVEHGEASHYGVGDGLHGQLTKTEEPLDAYGRTGAHRTAPMNSIVTVKNLDTGKSVTVRINDRGPYAKNRIIDITFGAARLIGLDRSGHAPVEIRICPPPRTARS